MTFVGSGVFPNQEKRTSVAPVASRLHTWTDLTKLNLQLNNSTKSLHLFSFKIAP